LEKDMTLGKPPRLERNGGSYNSGSYNSGSSSNLATRFL
jgi:hypothetical protein